MSEMSYQKKVRVHADSDEIYQALTRGFGHWWTRPDNPIVNVGDTATFTFPPGKSYWTLMAQELTPGKTVGLVCTDARHIHQGQPKSIETEWLGTQLIWRIKNYGTYREIYFTHMGLEPELLCFDICKCGWDHFFLRSLPAYLDVGQGEPHTALA
ncbi:hypothetical protein [Shewanella surugensis]|uniref:SRPBCC domain-containing protein n=1 Tax=Shewanella surugensis TaxID=212020 RepID=A0ABT0LCT8_9GAMM|nr:hypothetical protein [Shewanella surugensis]MCL1125142.1 hypothetical protein [Shewanella surugensis]